MNKTLTVKADSLIVKKNLVLVLTFPFLRQHNLDGLESAILLTDFAQQRLRKNAEVSDIYSTLN